MTVLKKRAWRNFRKYKQTAWTRSLRHLLMGFLCLELIYGGASLLHPVMIRTTGECSWQAVWDGGEDITYGIELDLKNISLNLYRFKSQSR